MSSKKRQWAYDRNTGYSQPGVYENEEREYFERALAFIREEVGEDNVFTATVHMDERNPHMHVCFVPLTTDKRLSAKTIIGNQKKLSEWQTKFHEHMSQRWNVLERGVSAMETLEALAVWLPQAEKFLA